MDLREYRQLVQYRFNYIRDDYRFAYEENYDYRVATEIIAYLITINFHYSDENGFGYNNLTNYYKNKVIDADESEDLYTNNFRKMQRREQKIRAITDNYQKYLNQNGFDGSNIYYMKRNQTGRFYDLANLEFIYQRCIIAKPFDLYDMVISGRICDSKHVSSEILADGYETLNSQYEQAKNTKDMMDYIVKWINLYRMETAMRYSLIFKIADYISNNEPIKDFALLRMTDVWGVRYFEGESDFSKEKNISQPFQILRHEKFIKPYFSAQTEEELSFVIEQAKKERILESILLKAVEDEAKDFFIKFRNEDELAILKIYLFCKYEYPIIENFTPLSLNLNGSKTDVDKRKVKCIRKIFKHLLKPEELKNVVNTESE